MVSLYSNRTVSSRIRNLVTISSVPELVEMDKIRSAMSYKR